MLCQLGQNQITIFLLTHFILLYKNMYLRKRYCVIVIVNIKNGMKICQIEVGGLIAYMDDVVGQALRFRSFVPCHRVMQRSWFIAIKASAFGSRILLWVIHPSRYCESLRPMISSGSFFLPISQREVIEVFCQCFLTHLSMVNHCLTLKQNTMIWNIVILSYQIINVMQKSYKSSQ